jgi:hypothetical protein
VWNGMCLLVILPRLGLLTVLARARLRKDFASLRSESQPRLTTGAMRICMIQCPEKSFIRLAK